MIIGVPKEIKNNENRVGMTPAGVAELVKKGHTVYVQATAGANSGFSDDDYIAVGAQILPAIEDVYAIADMIVKVKEPIAPEYKLIKKGQRKNHVVECKAMPCYMPHLCTDKG
jgi:alanine dehydrogenase